MTVKHNPRADRRRRLMVGSLDGAARDDQARSGRSASRRDGGPEGASRRRHSGYSQEVRRAFRWRLIQWLPIRRVAFLTVIAFSLALLSGLLAAHYAIYVSGRLPWYGHPLAVLLDISHPRSLATWVQYQLWLLCLVASIFIYQIRRFKLDDYRGEYRVWWWVIGGCGLASLNASTQWVDLMGQAADGWSRTDLGWSGSAAVQATMYVLFGMATMRISTELKRAPAALLGWLLAMASLAASSALAQEELRLDWSLQTRVWVRYGSWLAGQCLLWLTLLSYLRTIVLSAQQRFAPAHRSTESRPGRWRRFALRRPIESAESGQAGRTDPVRRRRSGGPADPAPTDADPRPTDPRTGSLWRRWIRPPRHSEDAPEFRKPDRQAEGDRTSEAPPGRDRNGNNEERSEFRVRPDTQSSESGDNRHRGQTTTEPDDGAPTTGLMRRAAHRIRGWRFPRLKGLPKPSWKTFAGSMRWPSIRLKPPRDRRGNEDRPAPSGPHPVDRQASAHPSTSAPATSRSAPPGQTLSDEELLSGQHDRPLTKAERKRLRRLQRQDRNRAA